MRGLSRLQLHDSRPRLSCLWCPGSTLVCGTHQTFAEWLSAETSEWRWFQPSLWFHHSLMQWLGSHGKRLLGRDRACVWTLRPAVQPRCPAPHSRHGQHAACHCPLHGASGFPTPAAGAAKGQQPALGVRGRDEPRGPRADRWVLSKLPEWGHYSACSRRRTPSRGGDCGHHHSLGDHRTPAAPRGQAGAAAPASALPAAPPRLRSSRARRRGPRAADICVHVVVLLPVPVVVRREALVAEGGQQRQGGLAAARRRRRRAQRHRVRPREHRGGAWRGPGPGPEVGRGPGAGSPRTRPPPARRPHEPPSSNGGAAGDLPAGPARAPGRPICAGADRVAVATRGGRGAFRGLWSACPRPPAGAAGPASASARSADGL